MGQETHGTAALIGPFDGVEGATLERAVERANSRAYLSTSILDSRDELAELKPKCLFVDSEGAELAKTTAWVREHPNLFSTPVIAMVSRLRDNSFVEAYRHGADDVIVRSDVGGVTRRVANLQHFDPSTRPAISMGRVLICHPADAHRRLLGRVLRQASFDVHFAASSDEIVDALASKTPPELVVVSNEILPITRIDETRRAAPNAATTPFVVVAAMASTRVILETTLERVATISESAPNDHLLFLTNDLLGDRGQKRRKSVRYLYDTICSFRPEGVFSPEYGLTYNMSETGIYVRTLDPPPKSKAVWLELRPPATAGAIHLRGIVARVVTPDGSALAAPPGFAFFIQADSSPARDFKLYESAYHTLATVPNQLAMSWRP